jgi:hypothetical protein
MPDGSVEAIVRAIAAHWTASVEGRAGREARASIT